MLDTIILIQTVMIGINTIVLLMIGYKTLRVVIKDETRKIY